MPLCRHLPSSGLACIVRGVLEPPEGGFGSAIVGALMFNLFHSRTDPAIVCVLRNGAVMPPFLRGAGLGIRSVVSIASRACVAALDARAEAAMAPTTGFYVFWRY